MKHIVYFSFMLVLTTCKPVLLMNSSYIVKENPQDELIFYSDSTFIYNYSLGFINYYSEGNWHGNKSIVLKSNYYDLNNFPIKVDEKRIENSDKIQINLITNDSSKFNKSVLHFELEINGKQYDIGFSNRFVIDTLNLKKIRVFVDIENMAATPVTKRLRSELHTIKNTKANDINIILPITLDAFYYIPIDSVVVKIKHNRIRWNDKIYTIK